MELYQSGAEEAFQLLYARHADKIYGFLRSRVWNDERAGELYQDVFLKMHRSKGLYNKSLPALPWMFSITRSVLVDGLRRERKFQKEHAFSSSQGLASTEDRRLSEVTGLLERLTDDQRQAVELRFVDERTFEEIASTLKTSPGNVRKLVSRAVGKLKAMAKKGNLP